MVKVRLEWHITQDSNYMTSWKCHLLQLQGKEHQLTGIEVKGSTGYNKGAAQGILGDVNVPYLVAVLCVFVNSQNCTLKRVNFTICILTLHIVSAFLKRIMHLELKFYSCPDYIQILGNSFSKMYLYFLREKRG